MKSTFKLLMIVFGLLLYNAAFSQTNTGTTPMVNSIHSYSVTKGFSTGSTLAWSVTTGTRGTEYDFVDNNGDVISGSVAPAGTSVSVIWKVANATPYLLEVAETRTGLDVALAGCPTTRQISVTVSANTFDVYAELVTAADACATVVNPVADAGTLGDNSDDTFGTTTREFKVKTNGRDLNNTWSFTYALTDIVTDDNVAPVTVLVTGGADASGTVSVEANVNEVTITVTYATNKNTSGANGQDPDFDLALTVSNGTDSKATPDSDSGASSNIKTYSIKAVPATTGILTN